MPPGMKGHTLGTDDIDLSAVPDARRTDVRNALRKHEKLWDGRLAQAVGVTHIIPLKEGALPFRLPPHRAGPVARQVEKEEVTKMLKDGVVRTVMQKYR